MIVLLAESLPVYDRHRNPAFFQTNFSLNFCSSFLRHSNQFNTHYGNTIIFPACPGNESSSSLK
jgi:hypothetical protein